MGIDAIIQGFACEEGEVEAALGKAQLLTAVLHVIPGGTLADFCASGEESGVSGFEAVLTTAADLAWVGALVAKTTFRGVNILRAGHAARVARGAVALDAAANIGEAGLAAMNAVDDPTAVNIIVAAGIATAILFGIGWQKKDCPTPQEMKKPGDEAVGAGGTPARRAGETEATAIGKDVHKRIADARRASGQFDLVQSPITDKNGNPIFVPESVDLNTGRPKPGAKLQEAVPDAVNFRRRLIIDDKPLGRPIAKDRQEIIRFIQAFQKREGYLPDTIAIQRYDPTTGKPLRTELYSPTYFLP